MNKYQIKLTRVWETYAEIEALIMEDAMAMYDSMVESGEMAQKELEQMGIADESYKITLLESEQSDNKTYVLYGSDMVSVADSTLLDAKAIAKSIHDGLGSINNLQVFEPSDSVGRIIETTIGWGDYMIIDKAKFDEIKSEYAKLESEPQDIVTLERVEPPTPKVWRNNDQVERQYYARKCSLTGEGMDEGWVVDGGEVYIKHLSDAIAYCQREWNQTLQEAYDESEANGGDQFYHTSWEDDESGYQYRFINGILIEEGDEGFEYKIDEDTLKQEYFTPTEEMQHRMGVILEDMARLREFIEENGIGYVFDKATKYSDSAWTHLNNIEIACDLDDNESLNWSKGGRD